jgi:hypothetical protein
VVMEIYAPEGVSVFQAYCRLREDRYPMERLRVFDLFRTAIRDVIHHSTASDLRVCFIGRPLLEADFSRFPLITIKKACTCSLKEPSDVERSDSPNFNDYSKICEQVILAVLHK